jgi:hypothetical protein
MILAGAAHAPAVRADGLSGLYVGGSYGRARNEFNTNTVNEQFQNDATSDGYTLNYSSSGVNRNDNLWWANAGYMVWPYVGIDASFLHLGELTYRATGTVQPLNEPLIANAIVTSRGPALSILARLPLAESLDVYVRVGDYFGKSTVTTGLTFDSKYTTFPQSSSTSSLLTNVGAAYTFAGHWSIRLDVLRINQTSDGGPGGKFNVNAATAGIAFTF